MPVTQIADVIVPELFSQYQVENSLVSTALFQSGALVRNGQMAAQLRMESTNFNIPFWSDLGSCTSSVREARHTKRFGDLLRVFTDVILKR